jgi:predicted DNA-binding transcriptional regulator YafY
VDRIHKARVIDSTARDVADSELDEQLAQLRHLLRCAEGLGDHPVQRQGRALGGRRTLAFKQQGRFLADGRHELKVPHSVSRELLMDVLHYGSDAETSSR